MTKSILLLTIFGFAYTWAQTVCDNGSFSTCANNPKCYFDTTLHCINKYNCSSKTEAQCKADKQCKLSVGSVSGKCLPKVLSCESYDKTKCLNNKLCAWLSQTQCVLNVNPPPVSPNCGSFKELSCAKNSEYCSLDYTCSDNSKYCSSLSQLQCKSDKSCSYQITQKEQCIDNTSICSSAKNSNDCAKYPGKCGAISSIQFCGNKFYCNGLSQSDCSKQPNTCKFENGTCSNVVDCSTMTTQARCQGNSNCEYMPTSFKCLPLEYGCSSLGTTQCKSNPWCLYVSQKGQCSQAKRFGCSNLSAKQCKTNSHCLLSNKCNPKKLPACQALTNEQCQKSTYCHIEDKGQCQTPDVICPVSKTDCQKFQNCEWKDTSSTVCKNTLDCSKVQLLFCNQLANNCKLSPAGCKLK